MFLGCRNILGYQLRKVVLDVLRAYTARQHAPHVSHRTAQTETARLFTALTRL